MNPCDAYAREVVSGRLPAGKYHRLACRRHLADRAREASPGFPFRFEWAQAEKFLRFSRLMKHYKGRQFVGQRFDPTPFQVFRLGSIFGWRHVETGLRRFTTAYTEVPRKQGKSFETAVVGIYVTFFEGEAGAEGYCLATKEKQARIVFDAMKRLVKSSGLSARIRVNAANLHREATESKLEPLGSDSDTTDGLNPHFIGVDELHAFKSRGMLDVVESATGARVNPLNYQITTAGNDPVSVCGDQHDYACRILDGVLEDDASTLSFFACMAHADEDDDPWLEATWQKANPHWGISIDPDDMRKLAAKAQKMPSAAAEFKQKRLGLWVNAGQPWLSLEGWRQGQTVGVSREAFIASLRGQTCWAGVDLSSKIDLTAVAFIFPPTDDRPRWAVVLKAFSPADTLKDRAHRDRAPYQVWVEQGWLETTPGTRIDQQAVRDALAWGDEQFDLREVGFDPWNAGNLPTDLQSDGFTEAQIIEIPQTFNHMSAPSKEIEADVLGGLVDAGGNPLLTWMVANAVVQFDGKDNIQPIKKKSRGRIDGVVAMIEARKLAALPEEPAKEYQVLVFGGR